VREELTVGLGERSYPILIGSGTLARLGGALTSVRFPKRVAVVTNGTVEPLYGGIVRQSLTENGFRVEQVVLPDGEEHKNLRTLETIYDFLIERSFDRTSGLLALGGGVIGDMTGYAAATFLRGVPFAQVPTTLLAQVDSSVGGKTGINHRLGKNLIGAFYQPRLVHIDVATLGTLPAREFAAGLAEVVKYGVIRDRRFFDWLGDQAGALRRLDESALVRAVKRSCEIKRDIVELDETETSVRAVLNFGHTFGHAVETLTGYGRYLHGEAVAIGMVVAAEAAHELGLCTREDAAAIRRLIASFDLPVLPPPLPFDDCLRAMGRDKKVREGVLRLVLNVGIGDCTMREIRDPEQLFSAVLNRLPEAE
jgi:3-dehydroquinate synthase